MNKNKLLLSVLLSTLYFHTILINPNACYASTNNLQSTQELSLSTSIVGSLYEKIGLLIVLIEKDLETTTIPFQELELFISHLKYCLEFTDQLYCDTKKSTHKLSAKKHLEIFDEEGKNFTLYIEPVDPKHIQISLWKTLSNKEVYTKLIEIGSIKSPATYNTLADELLFKLTGTKSPLLTSLAYCQQRNSLEKVICLTDVTGKNHKVIIDNNHLNVALRWHPTLPILCYTRLDKGNSILYSFNLQSNKLKTMCRYRGLNMQPAFSTNGQRALLCISGQFKNTEVYLYDVNIARRHKRKIFCPITQNRGNNSSPWFISSYEIIFCSDFKEMPHAMQTPKGESPAESTPQGSSTQMDSNKIYNVGSGKSYTNAPQIYYFNMKTKQTIRLTDGKAYSAAPAYHQGNNAIVYIKPINGVYQLFKIDLNKKPFKEEQLTTSAGDKLDPTWSPCGKYIAFTFDIKNEKTGKKIPQIAVFNTLNSKIRIITHGAQPKSYPAWSETNFFSLKI